MDDRPVTRYAKAPDGVSIAYQIYGEGPRDIVYVSNWGTQLDMMWETPDAQRVRDRLTALGRLVVFDHRGTGLSDPIPLGTLPSLEMWADDLRAVLDVTGIERAVLMGMDVSAPTQVMFAATHPERTAALILEGSTARVLAAPDYPCGVPFGRDEVIDFVVSGWGDPDSPFALAYLPGVGEEQNRQWIAQIQRGAESPATIRAMIEMMVDLDVRSLLPNVAAPTLVLHRAGDHFVAPAHGRYLAEHIPGARYVEISGDIHPVMMVDPDAALDEIEEFLTGEPPSAEIDRVLAAVMFTDVVGSTEAAARLGDRAWVRLLARHDDVVRRQLQRFRGTEVKATGDGFLATFDGPARAVRCAAAIRSGTRSLGLEIRCGLHTGEITLRPDDVGGIAVHLAQRINALACPGEILVSRTVVDLVVGSGLGFDARGEHELKGVPGTWQLFAVEA